MTNQTRSRQFRSSGRAAILIVGLTVLALTLVACGGGTQAGPADGNNPTAAPQDTQPSGSGQPASTGSPPAEPDAVAFAQCMRDNGVVNFPDPRPSGGFLMEPSIQANPNFQQAMDTCAPLRPTGNTAAGQVEPEQMLAFAQCMRENGVPDFPDPDVSTPGGAQMGAGGGLQGINTSSPAFLQALEECGSQHGIQIMTR